MTRLLPLAALAAVAVGLAAFLAAVARMGRYLDEVQR